MYEEDVVSLMIIIIGVIITAYGCVQMIGAIGHEAIYTTALDDTCKHLMNDSDAEFYEEIGWQVSFPCQLNNTIINFGDYNER